MALTVGTRVTQKWLPHKRGVIADLNSSGTIASVQWDSGLKEQVAMDSLDALSKCTKCNAEYVGVDPCRICKPTVTLSQASSQASSQPQSGG